MERLVTVRDVRDRYGCSMPTARRYLRQMFHYENPLAAPMWAFRAWEREREQMPEDKRFKTVQKEETITVPRRRANNDERTV